MESQENNNKKISVSSKATFENEGEKKSRPNARTATVREIIVCFLPSRWFKNVNLSIGSQLVGRSKALGYALCNFCLLQIMRTKRGWAESRS